ncbi:MAG: aminotransferase class I/II-fold pyridoxal phosphate-dependent enzyme [Thiofilum sp.]|uniref:aminotransferase class I/II-fold pyridoxal phosphate-dependent enzyme n=1 Tax=Thiofilum sp. TaxID=2212733 RepID=UPI0025D1B0E9|nr:aminotransferase class I/II-fold pyridoxal phosphate-dependent enzyme [Thiofilum sp.]MBK8453869.1 aminotransferase class I/II-fold pyridoxal phosphate-dependent enzyme [Thiofilum sp.]
MVVNSYKHTQIQLVFDTNVLVDALAARGAYYADAVSVLELVRNGEVEAWYAPHTLSTVYYLLERALAKDAQNRRESIQAARVLLQELSSLLKPLPQVGDELATLDAEVGDDLEDQLIGFLAEQYLPNPVIITRDKWFLKSSKILALHPKELLEQGLAAWSKKPEKMPFIDLAVQQRAIRPQLQRNIHAVLQHGTYIMGPEVELLEKKLAAYTGAKHCITVASGTEALLISLMALGIGAGDEVITTPFTFVATAEVIVLLGAKPVFVDIEPDTCNMDAGLIEAKITERTKAIMPVSLYGQPADMDEINAIAAKYNLPVIEDAAQSFGATYKGRKSCHLSTIGCTSFFPSKPLGCYGDGGAIFTDDDAIYQACREIRIHGQSRRYYHTRVGVGGRMDTLQCAVVLAKLERFDWEVEQRVVIGQRYNALMDEAGVQRIQQRDDRTSVFAQYTVLVENRSEVEARFREAGIPTAVHYPVPLNEQPAYRDLCCGDCTPIAKDRAQRVMSLPMGADLTAIQQDYVQIILSK